MRRKKFGSPVGLRFGCYDLGEPLEFRVSSGLCRQLSRKLALASGTNAENNVPASNRERNITPVIGFNHRECQIHPSGDAGGGPDASILDVDRIPVDKHCGTKAPQGVDLAPMSRRAAPVKRARGGQEERATADGCNPGDPIKCSSNNFCHGTLSEFRSHTRLAADRKQCIDAGESLRCDIGKCHIGNEVHAGRRWKGSGLWSRDLDAISTALHLIVGARKHLQRPCDVEQLAVGECEEKNAVGPQHAPKLTGSCIGPKAKLRSFPANPSDGLEPSPGCSPYDGRLVVEGRHHNREKASTRQGRLWVNNSRWVSVAFETGKSAQYLLSERADCQ